MALQVLLLSVVCLAGCQHTVPTSGNLAGGRWLVLERVGQIRSIDAHGREATPPRPGETIADHQRIQTGSGAALILARAGMQVTAHEATSFELAPRSGADLLLERGSLRLRLASAINHEARIETAHFGINASHAILSLRAAPAGSELEVDSGSVVLATIDGRHQATLVAGAGAKIDPASGTDLLIRPGAGQAYALAVPLQPAIPDDTSDSASSRPIGDVISAMDREAPMIGLAAGSFAGPAGQPVIRPASHPEDMDQGRNQESEATEPASVTPIPPAAQTFAGRPADAQPVRRSALVTADPSVVAIGRTPPEPKVERPSVAPQGLAPRQAGTTRSAAAAPDKMEWLDPLQLHFDRLTEGLVDDL
jgi:hypothetical protein